MNIMRLIICTFIFALLTSCGSIKIYSDKSAKLSKDNQLYIGSLRLDNEGDTSGTIGNLQYLLQANGYKMLPENYSYSQVTGNTVYRIGLNFTHYPDMFYHAYTNFTATIVDESTGNIVMTAHFRGDKNCKMVLKQLVNKMNYVFK